MTPQRSRRSSAPPPQAGSRPAARLSAEKQKPFLNRFIHQVGHGTLMMAALSSPAYQGRRAMSCHVTSHKWWGWDGTGRTVVNPFLPASARARPERSALAEGTRTPASEATPPPPARRKNGKP